MNPADVKEEILQAAQAYLDTGEIPYLPYQGYQGISNRGIVLSSNPIILPADGCWWF